MNLTEAQELVLKECEREKKIALRNLILVIALVVIVITLLAVFALPFISKALSSSDSIPPHIKYILPVAILLSLYYPIMRTRTIFTRAKKVDEFFALLQQGQEVRINRELESYLTTIPLGKVKYQLDPITYLYVSIGTQNFELPIAKYAAPELKRVLNQPQNLATYNTVMQELYSDETTTSQATAPQETIVLKPVEEFRTFAENEFGAELAAMEKGRTTTKKMTYVQFAFAFGVIGLIGFLVASGRLSFSNPVNIFIVIGIITVGSYVWGMLSKRYAQNQLSGAGDYTQVKKKIFGKLVNYISPQFAYYENAHIGIAEFLDSLLFKAERYTLKGGDQIVGHYNGMPFQSSNLSVTFRPNFRNEKEGDDVVFYGNYFVARSPKKFEHPIVIHPVKGFFSDLKDNEIATYLNHGGEKIRLEDPEFQKQFEVYCDDQITARYVLTPAFMQRLKKLNERHKGQVYIAINKYNIVIATNEGNALMRTDNSPTAMLFQKIDLAMVESVYRELIEQLQMLDTIGGRG
jgi:hypothetical protein